jgi:hypothetical protein
LRRLETNWLAIGRGVMSDKLSHVVGVRFAIAGRERAMT